MSFKDKTVGGNGGMTRAHLLWYAISLFEQGYICNIVRGRAVKANIGKSVKIEKQKYIPIEITRKQYFYAKEQSLVATPKEVVQEKIVWARTPASIITDRETSLIGGQTQKGEQLAVLDFDSLRADGVVNRYKIKQGKLEGYIYGKYLVFSKEEAVKRYKAEQYDKVHKAIKNPFGGGEAFGCDFYSTERVKFADNKMPEACYSLYLNISPSVIGNIEKYIDFAKKTKINTFCKESYNSKNNNYCTNNSTWKETFTELDNFFHYFTLQLILIFCLCITSVLKSNINLDTNNAVNTEETTPIASVTANP